MYSTVLYYEYVPSTVCSRELTVHIHIDVCIFTFSVQLNKALKITSHSVLIVNRRAGDD